MVCVIYMHSFTCVHVYICRKESMCVHTHVEAKGQQQMSSFMALSVCRQALSLNLELTNSTSHGHVSASASPVLLLLLNLKHNSCLLSWLVSAHVLGLLLTPTACPGTLIQTLFTCILGSYCMGYVSKCPVTPDRAPSTALRISFTKF